MQFPAELKMRPYSLDPTDRDGSPHPLDAWRPFDHRLRCCLAGGLRGVWLGGRSGFLATALVWILHLLLTPAHPGWAADLAHLSLIGGILGLLTGAALGLALADEE